jgi:hypothetical protein
MLRLTLFAASCKLLAQSSLAERDPALSDVGSLASATCRVGRRERHTHTGGRA